MSASVFFDGARGVVGSFRGRLAQTSDAGENWSYRDPPPRPSPEPDEPLERVGIVGERVLVRPGRPAEAVFHARWGGGDWERVYVGRDPVIDFALGGERPVVLTRDGRLAVTDAELRPVRVLLDGLDLGVAPGSSGGLSARGGRIVVFDGRSRIVVVERDEARELPLVARGEDVRWDFRSVDRARGGELYGLTEHGVWRSAPDGGWARLCANPGGFSSLALRGDDRLLLWSWKRVALLDAGSGRVEELPAFEDVWVDELQRYGATWIAIGARVHDGERALRVTRATHSRWVGDWLTGVVLVSEDAGVSWRVAHEWAEGRIEDALFLPGSRELVAAHAGSGLRAGPLVTSEPWSPETLVEPGELDWIPFDPVIRTTLRGELRAWVSSGSFRRPTKDEPRSFEDKWTWAAPEEYYRLGGGCWMSLARHHRERPHLFSRPPPAPAHVCAWQDGAFEPIRTFEQGCRRARIDAGGGLLLDLSDGAIWRLSGDGERWEELVEAR